MSILTDSLTHWLCAVSKTTLSQFSWNSQPCRGKPEVLRERVLNLTVNLMFTDAKWAADPVRKSLAHNKGSRQQGT